MSIKNFFRGSNMVEYAIPLAVIGVMVGLTLYSFSANDLLKNLVTSSVGGYVGNDGSLVVGHSYPTGNTNTNPGSQNEDPPIDTTPVPINTNPVACSNGSCTLDFDNFRLTGVPEDFSSFIKTNGVSGGENMIASLFKQIADQLAANPDNANPTDQEIIKQIRIMAGYTGTDIDLASLYPGDISFNDYKIYQSESNICALEYKIGGGNCNGNLTNLGNDNVQIYGINYLITDPVNLMNNYSYENSIKVNSTYNTFLSACNNSTTGKNYDKLKATIEYLKNQSSLIATDFQNNYIVSDFNDPNFGEINPIGIAAIRENVASNAENFTSQLMQMTN